jgi:hypothetical protein
MQRGVRRIGAAPDGENQMRRPRLFIAEDDEAVARAFARLPRLPRALGGLACGQDNVAARFLFGHFCDLIAARAAHDSQLTDEPEQDRPHNLCAPVLGTFGAHGRFDARAHTQSGQWFVSTHRRSLAIVAALLIASIAVLVS